MTATPTSVRAESFLRSWGGPLAVTALAAVIRIRNLGQPNDVIFDETYYAKDAISLRLFGYERQELETANELLIEGQVPVEQIFTDEAAFIVHPPLGKWIIAAGEGVFGSTPFGWRIAVAILGILSVLILARTLRRLSGSTAVGTIGGFLLAIDGMHIVLSRTALLDLIVSFWALVAFALLVLDRDHVRQRSFIDPDRLGHRPFRWLAAVALGCAIATKWSGLWFALFFGIMTIAWDIALRKQRGSAHPWRFTLLRDAPLTALGMLAIAAAVYLLSWTGWIRSDDGWGRTWASEQPPSFVPDWLRSLVQYHDQQLNFHTGLDAEHSYASQAWTWPFQIRPTSFHYETPSGCGADECASEVLALGNPIIWWAGVLAIGYQVWEFITKRRWQSAAVLTGFAAAWVPWLLFPGRTTFAFYAVAMIPFTVMALGLTAQRILQLKRGRIIVGAFLVVTAIVSWWFMPIWVGDLITLDQWRLRMWFPTWI